MTIQQLEYFTVLAEERHFTRAANRCRVTQPALSQQIRLLEESVGLPLVVRGKRPVDLTDMGKELLPKIQSVLADMLSIKESCQNIKTIKSGRLRIGMIPTIAPYLVREILPQWRERFPQVVIEIEEVTTLDMVRLINHEELDLGVASDLDLVPGNMKNSIIEEVLLTEPLMLAVPAEKLAIKDSLTWLSLGEGHCLRNQALDICKRDSNSGIYCHQMDTMISLVATGLGVAVVPEMMVNHDQSGNIVFENIINHESGEGAKRIVQLLSRQREQVNPVEKHFREALKSWVKTRN